MSVHNNLSLVPSETTDRQAKRPKTESSKAIHSLAEKPPAIIAHIGSFVSSEDSFNFVRSCKAFSENRTIIGGTFDLGKKEKILNTFIQRHINENNENKPFKMTGIFLYSQVQRSARSINLQFSNGLANSKSVNGQILATVFRTFPKLSNVTIEDSGNIADEGMRAIVNCKDLRVMKNKGRNHDSTAFVQKRVEYFAKLPNLEVLDLSEYSWGGLSKKFLSFVQEHPASFAKLQSLTLRGEEGGDLHSLRNLPALKSFVFQCIIIHQDDLEQIAACKNITDLTLRNMQPNDAQFAILGTMTQLEKLAISSDAYSLHPLMLNHLKKLENLRELCIGIWGKDPLYLEGIQNIPNLEKVEIFSIEHDEAASALSQCKKLKELILIGPCNDPKALKRLQESKPDLKIVLQK